jgi:hypothetical protein
MLPDVEARVLRLPEGLRNPEHRRESVGAPASGHGGAAALPAVRRRLTELLRDADPDTRRAAVSAVRAMGRSAGHPEILQALPERLRDEDPGVRSAAAEALRALRWAQALRSGVTPDLPEDSGEIRGV